MINRSTFVKAVAATGLALSSLGTVTVAQASSSVYFSIGTSIAPGVTFGVSNAPYYPSASYSYYPSSTYYPSSSYYQPAPVYYQPAPVYYQPAPVYYQPAEYAAPVVTYVRPYRPYRPYGHYYRY